MKNVLVRCWLIAGTVGVAYGQTTLGTIQWGNSYAGSSFRSVIYLPDPSDPGAIHVGQSSDSLEIPTGTTVYGGAPIGGTGYTFAFFAGPQGTPANQLVLYATTTFRTGIAAGLVSGGTATLTNVNAGDKATFQIRVWNNKGGTVTTWAAAEAAWLFGLTDIQLTPLVDSAPLGGTDSLGNPVFAPVDSGWVSFNTSFLAPEPSSFALPALGVAGLLIFHRRRS